MTLIKYRPYSLLNPITIRQEMDRLFYNMLQEYPFGATENISGKWQPQIDINEDADSYIVMADIPGVDPKDIKVAIDNNTLTIQGEKNIETNANKKGYQCPERFSGSFFRKFTLPANVDSKKISAKGKHGVLELRIPKSTAQQMKYIEVKQDD